MFYYLYSIHRDRLETRDCQETIDCHGQRQETMYNLYLINAQGKRDFGIETVETSCLCFARNKATEGVPNGPFFCPSVRSLETIDCHGQRRDTIYKLYLINARENRDFGIETAETSIPIPKF